MDVRLGRDQQLISATAARLGAQHAITGMRDLPPTVDSTADAWSALARSGLLSARSRGRAPRPAPRTG